MPPPDPDYIILRNVTPDDIFYIINNFDETKGTGPCSIPSKIVKLISLEISEPLSLITNLCFRTGVHPEKLKYAKEIEILESH